MICALCGSNNLVKKGTITQDGETYQRYKCKECSQYFKKIKIYGIDKRFINDEETSKEQVIKSIYEKTSGNAPMNIKECKSDKEYAEQVKQDMTKNINIQHENQSKGETRTMICTICNSDNLVKKGKVERDDRTYQRFLCKNCGKNFSRILSEISIPIPNNDSYKPKLHIPVVDEVVENKKIQSADALFEKIEKQRELKPFLCIVDNYDMPFELRTIAYNHELAARSIVKILTDKMNSEQKFNLANTIIHVFDESNNKEIFNIKFYLNVSFSVDNLSTTKLS